MKKNHIEYRKKVFKPNLYQWITYKYLCNNKKVLIKKQQFLMNITFNMNHNPKTIVKVIVVDSCRVVGTYFTIEINIYIN